jgi:hypothetical protein
MRSAPDRAGCIGTSQSNGDVYNASQPTAGSTAGTASRAHIVDMAPADSDRGDCDDCNGSGYGKEPDHAPAKIILFAIMVGGMFCAPPEPAAALLIDIPVVAICV